MKLVTSKLIRFLTHPKLLFKSMPSGSILLQIMAQPITERIKFIESSLAKDSITISAYYDFSLTPVEAKNQWRHSGKSNGGIIWNGSGVNPFLFVVQAK